MGMLLGKEYILSLKNTYRFLSVAPVTKMSNKASFTISKNILIYMSSDTVTALYSDH